MKLLFVGVRPGKALSTVLLANGFRLVEDGEESPDLVAIAPKSAAAMKDVARLRAKHPRTWIAVIIGRKWLRDADLLNAVLKCHDKNDVWFDELWESTFWFSVQRALSAAKEDQEKELLRGENRKLKAHYAELSASSDRLIRKLEKDVSLATNIQRSLLPKSSPVIPGVSLSVKYVPAAGLGGDYYDVFELGDRRRFGVLVADSKTHGMAAALLSVLIKTRVDEMKERFPATQDFVEYLNRELKAVQLEAPKKKVPKPPAPKVVDVEEEVLNLDDDFNENEPEDDTDDDLEEVALPAEDEDKPKPLAPLAVLYGILDRSTLTFRFTAAGHLRPILWRNGEPVPVIVAGNPPLGSVDQYTFRESSLQMRPGDLLILHTDGLEQPLRESSLASTEEMTAFDRVVQVLKNSAPSPDPLEVQNELMALIDQFVDRKPLADDLTLIHLAIDRGALYVAPKDDADDDDEEGSPKVSEK